MKELLIEVLGTEPPCTRCNTVYKVIEKEIHRAESSNIRLEKRNCADKETIKRFGVVIPPSVAVNGVIKIAGRIPSESEIKQIIESL